MTPILPVNLQFRTMFDKGWPYLNSSGIKLGASGITDDYYISFPERLTTSFPGVLQNRFSTSDFNL
jgi:hypothetical protein